MQPYCVRVKGQLVLLIMEGRKSAHGDEARRKRLLLVLTCRRGRQIAEPALRLHTRKSASSRESRKTEPLTLDRIDLSFSVTSTGFSTFFPAAQGCASDVRAVPLYEEPEEDEEGEMLNEGEDSV